MSEIIGRPTKLTSELQEGFTTVISAGNYFQAACDYSGISYQTFLNWMARGRDELAAREKDVVNEDEQIFVEFFEAVTRAEAEAEILMVAQWKEQIPQDWRAARDLLARRHPDRWAPKQYLDASVSGQLTLTSESEIDRQLEDALNELNGTPEVGSEPGRRIEAPALEASNGEDPS